MKDRLSRMILERFEAARIGTVSSTYDVVGFPPIGPEGKVAEQIVSAIEKTDTAAQPGEACGDERRQAVGAAEGIGAPKPHITSLG